jgi:DNA-binding CsgD family transcriptional regulator
MINCLLIDPNHQVSETLTTMMAQTPGFRLMATVTDISTALQLCKTFADLPVFYAVPANPGTNLDLLATANVLIVLSATTSDAALAYDQNALDFVSLPLTEQRLSRCLQKITQAIQQLNNGYADEMLKIKQLTDTQRKVLRKIGEQKTTRQIADELFISPKTVDTHRTNIRETLGFEGRRLLMPFAVMAVERKLI